MTDFSYSVSNPSRVETDTSWLRAQGKQKQTSTINQHQQEQIGVAQSPRHTKTLFSDHIFQGLRGYFTESNWEPGLSLACGGFEHHKPTELTLFHRQLLGELMYLTSKLIQHCYMSDQGQRLQNNNECDMSISPVSIWQRRINESWNYGARIHCMGNSSNYQTCKMFLKTLIFISIPGQMEIPFYWKHI